MNKIQSRLLAVFLLFFMQVGIAQELKLPAIFSDNMVLQQKTSAPIWGWSAPGKEVQVTGSWNNKTVKTVTDNSGKWMLKISTPAAGGPYTLSVTSDKSVTFQNVMIGEVWICSGQSNMEMPMVGWTNTPVLKSDSTIKASSQYPNIRLFNLQKKISETPLDDCNGQWVNSSPETVAIFSATGYFFGLELYKKLNIPVGLIMTAWGGTPSESWTAAEDIGKFDSFKPEIKKLTNHTLHKSDSIKYVKDSADWQSKASTDNLEFKGNAQKWMMSNIDDADWNKIAIPEGWQADEKLSGFTGIIWFRKTIEIPKEWEGKDLSVEFGPIDDMDASWVNGYKIGEHMAANNWNIPRKYTLPADKFKAGQNVIVVRMINLMGPGGINGTSSQLKIYPIQEGDSKALSLAGEWKYKMDGGIDKLPVFPLNRSEFNASYPSSLFNGMINPLIPFAIKGAIWYQGESNVYGPNLYTSIFPAMVKCWRSKWNQGDFPFYYVQIAPYDYGSASKSELLRESQLKSLKVIPNCGMVVTMDIGTIKNIHPPDKESVGKRLANWAFTKTYGLKNIPFCGPLYKKMMIENDKVRLYFDYAKNGLEAKGGELTNFEIAGKDQKFVPAIAVIDGNTVTVHSLAVPAPVAVRYGWSNTATPNLFNVDGLPASSFRTDDWDK
jgi:sialate O-acetylesterase